MIASLLAFTVRLFTGAYAHWRGCGPDPGKVRVYFANHTSHLDFVLLWSALPAELRARTRPAAGRDYWGASRWRKRIAEGIFRAVLIERKNITRSNNPVEQLRAVLAENTSVIIFPEGTRNQSADGKVGEFKSGLFRLFQESPHVDFVPVYLENLNRVLPKGEILPVPIICSAIFGAPLETIPDETKSDFLRRSREAVVALGPP